MKSGACAPYELYELKEQLELGELYEHQIKSKSERSYHLRKGSAG
jgi:hypothetical protein